MLPPDLLALRSPEPNNIRQYGTNRFRSMRPCQGSTQGSRDGHDSLIPGRFIEQPQSPMGDISPCTALTAHWPHDKVRPPTRNGVQ